MKTELNFLELHFLVKELRDCVGARIAKIYEPDGLLFQLHKASEGKIFLHITDKVFYRGKEKSLMPEHASGFCSSVRKVLEGKRIESMEQVGSERVVHLVCKTLKETLNVYIELFGKGNFIVASADNKILIAKDERIWKDREIRRGKEYVLPPAKRTLFELSKADIVADEKSLASLGFGKLLAKEIMARGGTFEAYQSLINAHPSPRRYADGELSAIKLHQYKEEGTSAASFSELIDANLSKSIEQQKRERIVASFEGRKQKLVEVIRMQSAGKDALERSAVELQRKGELIYEHYQELQDVLTELNKAKSKYSLHQMRDKLKGHPKIKNVDPKTADIIVDIQ